MSKGSKPRPLSVNEKTFADSWDRVFSQNDGVRVGATPVSKTGNVGAIPTTPAKQEDDD